MYSGGDVLNSDLVEVRIDAKVRYAPAGESEAAGGG